MMIRTSSLVLPALAALLAAPAAGQVGHEEAGASATLETKAHALVRVAVGPEAAVTDGRGQTLGHFHDHVIERKTGNVLFAVVETKTPEASMKRVRVDFARLDWNAEKRAITLPMTPEQVAGLPEFDPEQALDPEATPVRGGESIARGDGSEASAREAGALIVPPRLLATEIRGAEIVANGETEGEVSDLVLSPLTARIALVLVERADTDATLVVPWKALELDEEGRYVLAETAGELSAAPTLRGGDLRSLEAPERLKEIFSFYGLEVPRPIVRD